MEMLIIFSRKREEVDRIKSIYNFRCRIENRLDFQKFLHNKLEVLIGDCTSSHSNSSNSRLGYRNYRSVAVNTE